MGTEHLRPYLELEGICRDPLFIIGSPRSGTTALGHALNRHPELWTSKESYVLHRLYGNGQVERVWRQHWDRVTPSWLRAEDVGHDELLGFLGLGMNALYSSRSGGLRWVDPTPLNTRMVGELAQMFPGASFVHIVRDGRSVVRSMAKFRENLESKRGPIPDDEMPAWTHDFRRACETWAEYVETASEFAAANPDRCLEVRNEELSADPVAGFERLETFLGLAADGGPAEFFAGKRINSSFRDEHPTVASAELDGWTPERRRTFAEIAGAALVAAGYADAAELRSWTTADR